MNRLIRRVLITLAPVTLAGGALLGVGGSASAATASKPMEHAQSSIAAFGTGERDDGWHAHRGWHRDDDHRRHHHHRKWEQRWDGHRLYVWSGDGWVEVSSLRDVDIDGWYLDQLVLAQR